MDGIGIKCAHLWVKIDAGPRVEDVWKRVVENGWGACVNVEAKKR
jgi:hypothetical protein